jgi:hypothetical protein
MLKQISLERSQTAEEDVEGIRVSYIWGLGIHKTMNLVECVA